MATRGFFAPIHVGVFAHRRAIGAALWEFALLISWVTKETPDPDLQGEMLGLVRAGTPISIKQIAQALNESVGAAKKHLARLEDHGYIVRNSAAGEAYTYAIKRSKKWTAKAKSDASTPATNTAQGADTNVSRPSYEHGPPQLRMYPPNKEKNKETSNNKKTLSSTTKVKRSSKADSRFGAFTEALFTYWHTQNPELGLSMAGGNGAALNRLLEADKSLTVETFRQWLTNRANSDEVNHAAQPKYWLDNITQYAHAPLDKYNRPKSQKGAIGGTSNARTKEAAGLDAIGKAAARLIAGQPDGVGAGHVPEAAAD